MAAANNGILGVAKLAVSLKKGHHKRYANSGVVNQDVTKTRSALMPMMECNVRVTFHCCECDIVQTVIIDG